MKHTLLYRNQQGDLYQRGPSAAIAMCDGAISSPGGMYDGCSTVFGYYDICFLGGGWFCIRFGS